MADPKPMTRVVLWWRKWIASGEYPRMQTMEERMWHSGRNAGIKDGRACGWREGYEAGRHEGFEHGRKIGFEQCGRLLGGKS